MISYALVAAASFLTGLAIGWWLRLTTSWCKYCGHKLACIACRRTPSGEIADSRAVVSAAGETPRSVTDPRAKARKQ
ncbi:hypothetical protein [Actinoplanes sp. NPDC051859]|uniref:hypothetical protein n=1 Tax=Actinoplanes sp. NPDC051859 TaxID=3363909 RepID=UPI003788E05C